MIVLRKKIYSGIDIDAEGRGALLGYGIHKILKK